MALTGPVAVYAGSILSFGVGALSGYALTRYALSTLLTGSIFGLVAGIVCGVTGCRGWRSALWSGGVIFLIIAILVLVLAGFVQPLAPQRVPATFYSVLLAGLTGIVVGYSTSRLARDWERRAPAARSRPSSGDLPAPANSHRYRI